MIDKSDSSNFLEGIAIIGMSGRFPGAKNVEEFWSNLQDGVESISFFSEKELESAGVPKELVRNPNYVKANAVLENIDLFDAKFFGFNPKEAQITDPQHRIFLECVWESLENAGYNPETYGGSIGLYAGADGFSSYFFQNLYSNRNLMESIGAYQIMIANQIDFLCSRVSYKLNLTGPSVTVQTACSTSLVATSMACQSLLCYECDIALAGGVSIRVPQKTGYVHQPGMIFSDDGHCRAFDAKAQGTVGGNGAGVVVLKRLSEAIADGDCIHAVIKGSAINNDGSVKVGYTAPSVDGQAAVIAQALANAEVSPETISYIEAHGTGTPLGDPIEIAALKQVFSTYTQKRGFCAIGSVKTNMGHLDAAAGVAGLIKTVCALKHKMLPPTLHFEKANPEIDFGNSPFYVNTKLSEWKANGSPRRAGISSFGIGGTNAHIILEEAPTLETRDITPNQSRPYQLLAISAKSEFALKNATTNLGKHIQQHPQINLADVAYTLGIGRKAFEHREVLVCSQLEDVANTLRFNGLCERKERSVVFMFSGQGSQYVNMAREVYKVEPIFQKHVDSCSEILKHYLNLDLRDILYPQPDEVEAAAQQLKQTTITQPALFAIEYALAQLWISWGVRPTAMIGHSIGEYVAACLAGVFSLEDALFLVAERGRLMQQLPKGSMLAVKLPPEQVQSLISNQLSLAAINGPSLCVVAGTAEAINTLQMQLAKTGVECQRLHTSHAFHSFMMEPILKPFAVAIQKVELKPPQIPYVSNVTGTWVTAEQVTEPSYWAKHLRHEVRFADGLQQLFKEQNRILLEIGPGRTLTTLANRHPDKSAEQIVLSSLRHPQQQQSDVEFLLTTLGKLWLAGVDIDWSGYYIHEQRYRIPLPTYPFERQSYWIEPQAQVNTLAENSLTKSPLLQKQDIAPLFYIPEWQRSALLASNANILPRRSTWVVFADECGLGSEIANQLELQGQDVITVTPGSRFSRLSDSSYTINPQYRDDYDAFFHQLRVLNKIPKQILHLWSVTPTAKTGLAINWVEKSQEMGFFSLLYLAQAIGKLNIADDLLLCTLANSMQNVVDEAVLYPEKATVLGPIKVISAEYPNINCRSIDIVLPQPGTPQQVVLIDQLLLEFNTSTSDSIIAYRDGERWVQNFQSVKLDANLNKIPKLRERGVYLITGGLGGIGLTLAEYLAQSVRAKLILCTRSLFPEKEKWQQWLDSHEIEDETSSKIQKLQTIEKLGAEVLIISADIANIEQMQKVKSQVLDKFGQIHGIIHCAGIAGDGVIQLKTREKAEKVLASKVKGTLVLDTLFKDASLDFFVLCSSLTAILGDFGQVDYCAANAFLDAFAQYKVLKDGTFAVSINWDSWQEVGMAAAANISASHQKQLKSGILPTEGVDIFRRILSSKHPQVIVSTRDLRSQIEQNNASVILDLLKESHDQRPKTRYPRPAITNAYVAPTNEIERAIANIWEDFLGIERVGIDDDFFELGGDSLLAVQLIFKVRETLKIEISTHSLLDSPTVAQLAALIAPKNRAKRSLSKSLVEIKAGSRKQALFLMHPVGGHVYFYRDLANCLHPDLPVYGLQARGIEGEAEPLTQVEEMATQYIEALRTVQPEGPYFLGGASFGGTLAFEMAQQLHAVGEKVELLAMIDTPGPGEIPATLKNDEEIILYLLPTFRTSECITKSYRITLCP